MKVLIIGGMHGNEPLGVEVVKRLQQQPIKNVDTVLANEPAIAQDCRFVGTDLNRSFPGNSASKEYERRRANELMKLCSQYDVVFDFHNTHCARNDCGFVGETANQSLYDLSAWLGLKRIIVADYDCINKYAPNCLSVEISLDSPRMNIESWLDRISELASLRTLPKAMDIEKFRFVYRMTIEDRDNLQLPDKNLRAFEPIEKRLATAMGVSSPAYPIFIADAYTPYNYGGLLNRLN
jgi:hypothetical protein